MNFSLRLFSRLSFCSCKYLNTDLSIVSIASFKIVNSVMNAVRFHLQASQHSHQEFLRSLISYQLLLTLLKVGKFFHYASKDSAFSMPLSRSFQTLSVPSFNSFLFLFPWCFSLLSCWSFFRLTCDRLFFSSLFLFSFLRNCCFLLL